LLVNDIFNKAGEQRLHVHSPGEEYPSFANINSAIEIDFEDYSASLER
jgi:hypothetical protein